MKIMHFNWSFEKHQKYRNCKKKKMCWGGKGQGGPAYFAIKVLQPNYPADTDKLIRASYLSGKGLQTLNCIPHQILNPYITPTPPTALFLSYSITLLRVRSLLPLCSLASSWQFLFRGWQIPQQMIFLGPLPWPQVLLNWKALGTL